VAPEIRDAVLQAGKALEALGFPIEEFAPTGLERAPNLWAFLFSQWPSSAIRKLTEGHEADLHWTLRENLSGASPRGDEILTHLAARDRMRAALVRQMQNTPVLLMPVCGITAFRHRERKFAVEDKEIGLFQAMMPAVIANVFGLPAVTIPMGRSRLGLPVGVQLVGRPYEDELLLELAVLLENRGNAS
jgi:Asp-tRNA(Asn)/Glu-tRNA(Gln) amidotransferase A subunit family amidase